MVSMVPIITVKSRTEVVDANQRQNKIWFVLLCQISNDLLGQFGFVASSGEVITIKVFGR